MDPILQKFRDKFYEEANGLLDQMEKEVLELEKTPDNPELIDSAFRAMHTIKGVSGMYGFDFICEFTHCMESMYQAIRENKMKFDKEISDISLLSIDHIRKLLADERLSDPINHNNHNQLINDITIILKKSSGNVKEKPVEQNIQIAEDNRSEKGTWHILLRTDEKIYFRGISLVSIFRELSQLGEFQITRLDFLSDKETDTWSILLSANTNSNEIKDVFLFIEDSFLLTKISEKNLFDLANFQIEKGKYSEDEKTILEFIEHGGEISATEKTARDDNNIVPDLKTEQKTQPKERANIKRISVDSSKLDNLMYLVSELITVNSQLTLHTSGNIYNSIRPYVEIVDNLSKQFRNTALEIRLVPLSDIVLRFQRLIRDLSKHLKKKVELVTQGIDTELDKNTIDHLSEPLMHIIRNCIDHGIELPDQRVRKGKPETGIIKISACHSGNYIIIKVEDDGIGVNCEKIRAKAIDKGIIQPTDKPTTKELFDFIFLPGFSTAQSLTEVSGRGIGMDIVKKKILDLRGDVKVESREGVGTTFTLKLQQSVTIIDTLLFKVEDCNFIVPLSEIKICSQVNIDEIEKRRHTSTLPFDDRMIPFIDLRKKLSIGGYYNHKVKVIILTNNENLVAILTDKIVGEHQAVLKPLGKSFRNQDILTSASQLGNGRLALMIDTNNIFKSVKSGAKLPVSD
jgi:two-component system, chemotaxis family, sensor kinase CheA